MVKFCIDKIIDGKPYPNLASWQARPYTPEWRQFSLNWPYSEPVHFFEYLDQEGIPYQLVPWTLADRLTFYPISLSFFDFSIDWFEILPTMIKEKLRSKTITLWFFYSEGDNPQRIQQHLYAMAQNHDIDCSLIQFTSANSASLLIPGFHHFVDDELLYRLRNESEAVDFHCRPRSKKFTALVRTHKWWRATTMARIWIDGYHGHGFFSYNLLDINEAEHDNPIEVDSFDNLRAVTHQFLSHCPFSSDSLSSDEHNLYATTVCEHHDDSYLNVILETHLDADQSGGVFLTEKTFKAIKHCQPFIIFGCENSVQMLRDLGYRTFDHVIDHSYDTIKNNTQRWDLCYREFARLMHQDLHKLYLACEADLIHNQKLFLADKRSRLNRLLTESIKYATISQ